MRKTRNCPVSAEPSCYEKALLKAFRPQTRKTREHQQGGSTSSEGASRKEHKQGGKPNMEGAPASREHQPSCHGMGL